MVIQTAIAHFHLQETDSSNNQAKEKIRSQAIHSPFIVTADHQTQGRGTKGRVWYSEPSKQLLYTFAFPVQVHEINPAHLVYDSADIVIHHVKHCYDIALEKEWPNDLILNNRKCGGILVELIQHAGFMWIVFGLGLNINTTFFPEYLNYSATSFYLETKKEYDKQLIIQPLTAALQEFFETL